MKRFTIALGLCFAVLLVVPEADAKTNRELTYRYDQIWGTVIRFLRVDHGFKIVEKDKTEGYILFVYKDGERAFNSSIELVSVEIEGRRYIRTGLNVQNMPSYVEILLQDKLKRKLRNEYGDAPPPRLVAPAPVPSEKKKPSDDDESEEEQIEKEDAKSESAKED